MQLENWSQAKKVALIDELNPSWIAIGDQAFGEQCEMSPPSASLRAGFRPERQMTDALTNA
jgi:hypothetical protein